MRLIDVAIRWQDGRWVAFNIGPKPPFAHADWSSPLGNIDFDEVLVMFRNSTITILPARISS